MMTVAIPYMAYCDVMEATAPDDCFNADFGDGTESNPYSGVISTTELVERFEPMEIYVETGTEFREVWLVDNYMFYRITSEGDDIGLYTLDEMSTMHIGLWGTADQVGTMALYYSQGSPIGDFGDPELLLTIHVVERIVTPLEFLSDPTSGTITYVS